MNLLPFTLALFLALPFGEMAYACHDIRYQASCVSHQNQKADVADAARFRAEGELKNTEELIAQKQKLIAAVEAKLEKHRAWAKLGEAELDFLKRGEEVDPPIFDGGPTFGEVAPARAIAWDEIGGAYRAQRLEPEWKKIVAERDRLEPLYAQYREEVNRLETAAVSLRADIGRHAADSAGLRSSAEQVCSTHACPRQGGTIPSYAF